MLRNMKEKSQKYFTLLGINSIVSTPLNRRERVVGVKFYDLFLPTEQLERNFSYISMILPFDCSEILNSF